MDPLKTALELLNSLKPGESPNYTQVAKSMVVSDLHCRDGTVAFRAPMLRKLKMSDYSP